MADVEKWEQDAAWLLSKDAAATEAEIEQFCERVAVRMFECHLSEQEARVAVARAMGFL